MGIDHSNPYIHSIESENEQNPYIWFSMGIDHSNPYIHSIESENEQNPYIWFSMGIDHSNPYIHSTTVLCDFHTLHIASDEENCTTHMCTAGLF